MPTDDEIRAEGLRRAVEQERARRAAGGQPTELPPEPPGLLDSFGRQVGLGARALMQGATSLPALAGDIINEGVNLPIRGINAVAGTQIPELGRMSDVVNRGIDAVTPTPNTPTERVVNRIAREMASMGTLGMAGNAVQGAGRAGSVIADVLAGRPALGMAGAAGAGAGAGLVNEAFPDNPAAELAGSIGGAVLGTGAYQGISYGANLARALLQPLTAGGREQIVGETLARMSGRPQSLGRALADNPTEIVPGSVRTTAEVADDVGLMSGERAVRSMDTRTASDFALRDAARNTARDTYLRETAPGGPINPVEAGNTLRGRLAAALRRSQGEVSRAYNGIDPGDTSVFSGQAIWNQAAPAVSRVFGRSTEGTPSELLSVLQRLRAERLSFQDLQALGSDLGAIAGRAQVRGDGRLASVAGNIREIIQGQIDNAAPTTGFSPQQAAGARVAAALRRNQGAVYEEGAVGDVLNRNSFGRYDMPAENVPRTLMGGPTAVRQMEAAVGSDAVARQAAQGAFIQQATRAIETGTPDAAGNLGQSAARFHAFLRDNLEQAQVLFGREGVERLNQIARDFTSRQMVDNAGRAVGSNTVQNLSTANAIAAATGGLINPTGLANSRLGAAMSFFYRGSERMMRELLSEAMLNPDVARRLVDRVSPENLAAISAVMQRSLSSRAGDVARQGAVRLGTVLTNSAAQQ